MSDYGRLVPENVVVLVRVKRASAEHGWLGFEDETGKFQVPGGAVREGEQPRVAALRFCLEDVGIVIPSLHCLARIQNTWLGAECVTSVYLALEVLPCAPTWWPTSLMGGAAPNSVERRPLVLTAAQLRGERARLPLLMDAALSVSEKVAS